MIKNNYFDTSSSFHASNNSFYLLSIYYMTALCCLQLYSQQPYEIGKELSLCLNTGTRK